MPDEFRRTLIERFHRFSLVFSRANFFQVKTSRLNDLTCFKIYRKQRGSTKNSYIYRDRLMAELENLFTQERVIFAFRIEGAKNADCFGIGATEVSYLVVIRSAVSRASAKS